MSNSWKITRVLVTNIMLAIIDYRTSDKAIGKLETFADVLLFRAPKLVMPPLEGHPDIFIFQDAEHLIVAPNTPAYVIDKMIAHGIDFHFGESEVKLSNDSSTYYNCVSTTSHFIHNLKKTDPVIQKLNKDKKQIHTRQAYTRCSLTSLSSDRFITSDKNIAKVLIHEGLQVLFVNPESIELPGFRHGLFGGTNGIFDGRIFFNGNLAFSDPDSRIRNFINETGLEIIQLHDGPLFDGGSIFFIGS